MLLNFYRRFVPQRVATLQPLEVLLAQAKSQYAHHSWSDIAVAAFMTAENALANANLFEYPWYDAPIRLMVYGGRL